MNISDIAKASGETAEDVQGILDDFDGDAALYSLLGASTDLSDFVTEALAADGGDFEFDGFRFIRASAIDEIMQDELSSDPYVLGCFNASFIADVTGWPLALIKAGQDGEQFEAIGQGILDNNFLEPLQKAYAKADGYGHHFGHYDGYEHELGDWFAFRI
jgi:hypothetical protein